MTAASASRILSAAGCISGEWNGALTFSAIARLMPLAFAISPARSIAALVPEITTCPGALSLATTQTGSLRLAERFPPLLWRGFGEIDFRAEQCAHRAFADRHGLLHRPAARFQKTRSVGEREGARGAKRGVFAERMTGDEARVFGEIEARLPVCSTRMMAMLAAMIAGWAFSVRRDRFRALPTSGATGAGPMPRRFPGKLSRAGAKASASALPMPTAWLPWPGK